MVPIGFEFGDPNKSPFEEAGVVPEQTSEEWRNIGEIGYEVSNFGRVRTFLNTRRNIISKSKILKPWQSGRKYNNGKRGAVQVVICTEKGHNKKKVHHLVLEAFVGLCPEGMECAHKDGNILNNRLDNLEWTTHIENEKHKKRHKTLLYGEKATCVKLTEKKVQDIKKLLRQGKLTQPEIAERFSVSREAVTGINIGRNWRHVK